jgi:hypothetical protein
MTTRRLIVTLFCTAAIATSSGGSAIAAGTGSERTGTVRVMYPKAKDPNAGRWNGPCSGWRYGEFHETVERMRRLTACVFGQIAPTEVDTALYVVGRESGFFSHAYNASGCAGLMQHMLRYWPGRVASVDKPWFRRWFNRGWGDVYDPMMNLLVGAIMVRNDGWGAWSTA